MWKEIIENNKERIIDECVDVYKNSIEYQNLEYVVEIDKDCNLHTYYHASGSNSFSQDSFDGFSLVVFSINNSNWKCEIRDSMIEDIMSKNDFETIEKCMSDDDFEGDIETYIINEHTEFKHYIDQIVENEKKFDVENYAYEIAEFKINQLIDELDYKEKENE